MTRARVTTMALVALVVVIYGAVVTAYATSGGDPSTTDTRQPSANGVLVYLDLDGLDGDTYSLDTRVSVYPGKDHLDSDGRLDRAMTVSVTPAASTDTMTFPAGTRAGSRPLTLYIDGDIHRWPFDTYNATGLQVRVTSDGSVVPAEVVVTNLMTSWAVHQHDVDSSATGNAITISAARTPAVIGFALALCVVLLVLPTLTLFVAISTLRRRKQFLPPIVTWFAVMLFAVIPLRNLFPGNPPIGSWVDYTVVLWVVVGLTVALTLYITAWWKHGQ